MFRQALALLATGLAVNGVTLLGEGEVLHGKVTRIKRSGPRCRNGEVNWNATVGVVILKDHHVSY